MAPPVPAPGSVRSGPAWDCEEPPGRAALTGAPGGAAAVPAHRTVPAGADPRPQVSAPPRHVSVALGAGPAPSGRGTAAPGPAAQGRSHVPRAVPRRRSGRGPHAHPALQQPGYGGAVTRAAGAQPGAAMSPAEGQAGADLSSCGVLQCRRNKSVPAPL